MELPSKQVLPAALIYHRIDAGATDTHPRTSQAHCVCSAVCNYHTDLNTELLFYAFLQI
jgi:hypothetical protein